MRSCRHQERELADQLFKLKFQLNMGQTESLKKIRGLRKDIARVKTIMRRAVARRAGRNGEEVMAETTQQAAGRRKEVVGEVVSNKMNKTIVVAGDAQEVAPALWPRHLHRQEVLRARRKERSPRR